MKDIQIGEIERKKTDSKEGGPETTQKTEIQAGETKSEKKSILKKPYKTKETNINVVQPTFVLKSETEKKSDGDNTQ